MTTLPLESALERINSLPTLPTVVMALNERLSNERASSEDVARVIEADQALASQVLRLANSSFFGFKNRIADIRQAVSLMGFSTIRDLALAASVLGKLRGGRANALFSPARFWEHAIATAVAARALAGRVDPRTSDEAFTGGLLHDIGKIVLHIKFADEFHEALRRHREERIPLVEAEQTTLGFTHADVGYRLGKRWRFPLKLQEAILYHHRPTEPCENARLVMMVHVANVLVEAIELGRGGQVFLEPIDQSAWQELALTPQLIDLVLGETVRNASATFDFLSVIQ
jgi:putative nucleotidyltransferase with HDIG domain